MITIIGPWLRDTDEIDPSARVRLVEVDGRTFYVCNVLGPGWPMVVRPARNPHFVSGMADWECWDQVELAARECVELKLARS